MTFTGSVTTADGSGQGQSFNSNEDGLGTPRAFDVDEDANSKKGAGTYPNYWGRKDRSGNWFSMDASEGNETITLQHRSGSSVQFRPDGGLMMTTHNGKYEVTFGENRVTISGAHDVTIKGDASIRAYGNNNVTVHKDYNMTVMGDFNLTAKNMNQSIRGNWDVEAKNINHAAEGSGTYGYGGGLSTVSKGNMTTISTSGNRYDGAGKDHHTKAKSNKTTDVGKNETHVVGEKHELKIKASVAFAPGSSRLSNRRFGSGSGQPVYQQTIDKNGVQINNTKDLKHKVNGDTEHQHGGDLKEKITGKKQTQAMQGIEAESQQNYVVKAMSSYQATAGSNMDLRAPSGSATFAGQQTAINAIGGVLNLVGQGGGINVDSLGGLLNLNGAIGTIASALGLQLSFDFGDITSNIEMPDITGAQADQPQEEPDLTSEISSWL
jgi:uncharacterized protein (DUF2345 family)